MVFGWMLLGKGFAEGVHVPNTITFNIMVGCSTARMPLVRDLVAEAEVERHERSNKVVTECWKG
jgi:hypothetical protein